MGQAKKERAIAYYKQVRARIINEINQNKIEEYYFRQLVKAGIIREDKEPGKTFV